MAALSPLRLLAAALCATSVGCVDLTPDAANRGGAPQAATAPRALDAATEDASTDAPEGELFGERVSSYVTTSDGGVTSVGVVVPLAAIEAAPASGGSGTALILDMPAAARAQTFVSQLRVNWLAHGHYPTPYDAPHFDFHFHRGTSEDIDAIDCAAPAVFPPEILSPAHQPPELCVGAMGYHAWPRIDLAPGTQFTASLILGYTPRALVFIEPMITRATLLGGRDFELSITPPAKSGAGTRTRFPTRARGLFDDDGATVRLELDRFVDLD